MVGPGRLLASAAHCWCCRGAEHLVHTVSHRIRILVEIEISPQAVTDNRESCGLPFFS